MGRAINLISLKDGEWDEFKKAQRMKSGMNLKRLTVRRQHELYKVKGKEGIE